MTSQPWRTTVETSSNSWNKPTTTSTTFTSSPSMISTTSQAAFTTGPSTEESQYTPPGWLYFTVVLTFMCLTVILYCFAVKFKNTTVQRDRRNALHVSSSVLAAVSTIQLSQLPPSYSSVMRQPDTYLVLAVSPDSAALRADSDTQTAQTQREGRHAPPPRYEEASKGLPLKTNSRTATFELPDQLDAGPTSSTTTSQIIHTDCLV